MDRGTATSPLWKLQNRPSALHGSQTEGARKSLMRLAQRCERVEGIGDLVTITPRGTWSNRPKLRLDISQCVAEIAMFAGKPFNGS